MKGIVFDILENLIAIDTSNPPGNERQAAEYLCRLFDTAGIDARLQDLGENRANLIAAYGEGERELLFCGHLDVVPAAEGWTYPPFQMTEKGNRLYGRGTSDMKGAVAAMSAVMLKLAKTGAKLQGKLTLVFVADEECSNKGMQEWIKRKKTPDFAVIGEPTKLNVAVAHRGVLREYIDITAPAFHAALPGKGSDAVQEAAAAVSALYGMNDRLKAYCHEVLPPPSIAVTMIEGYEKDNIVPGHVRLLTDFRILPGMTYDACRRLMEGALEHIKNCRLTPHFFMPGAETPADSRYVRDCCTIAGEILGVEQHPAAFGASCEQYFLVRRGIPTVICGPGSLGQAHTRDEYVETGQIRDAEAIYRNLVREFLGGDTL